jgi:hypothetical protein
MPDATGLNQTLSQDGDGSELGELVEDEKPSEVAGASSTATLARLSSELGVCKERVRRMQQEAERVPRTGVKLRAKRGP